MTRRYIVVGHCDDELKWAVCDTRGAEGPHEGATVAAFATRGEARRYAGMRNWYRGKP